MRKTRLSVDLFQGSAMRESVGEQVVNISWQVHLDRNGAVGSHSQEVSNSLRLGEWKVWWFDVPH